MVVNVIRGGEEGDERQMLAASATIASCADTHTRALGDTLTCQGGGLSSSEGDTREAPCRYAVAASQMAAPCQFYLQAFKHRRWAQGCCSKVMHRVSCFGSRQQASVQRGSHAVQMQCQLLHFGRATRASACPALPCLVLLLCFLECSPGAAWSR